MGFNDDLINLNSNGKSGEKHPLQNIKKTPRQQINIKQTNAEEKRNTKQISSEDRRVAVKAKIYKPSGKNVVKKRKLTFFKFVFFFFFLTISFSGLYLTFWIRDFETKMPSYESLKNYNPSTLTRVYAQNGTIINYDYKENRIYVPISQIPSLVKNAFIAVEDKTFYKNIGIDIIALCKAIIQDTIYVLIKKGSLVGGSTITQQVVKNIILTNEKTISRKLKEMIIAVKVTNSFTKDEILEIYLNHIFLGSGSYGVYSAALNYFGKELKDLTVEEAATLAALPKAPSLLDPSKGFERTINRRNWAIQQMFDANFITKEQAINAMKTPVSLIKSKPNFGRNIGANAFSLSAIEEIAAASNQTDIESLSKSGLFIQTTLKTEVQEALYSSFRKGLEAYDKRHGFRGAIGNINKIKINNNFKSVVKIKIINDLKSDQFDAEKLEFAERSCLALYKFNDPTKQDVFLDIASVLTFNDNSIQIIIKNKTSQQDNAMCDIATINQDGYSWVRANSQPYTFLRYGDVIVVKKLESEKLINEYALEQIPEVNGSAIAIDPQTGRILALVGGYTDNKGDFNRAIQAMRQTGSATKPFIYLSALENGFNPATPIIDAKISLLGSSANDSWSPKNHNGKFYGAVTLRYALERSLNIPTVRLAEMVGVKKILNTIQKLNLYANSMERDFSVVLGAVETNLLSVTKAFSIVANGGYDVKPYFVDYSTDKNGTLTYKAKNICKTEDGINNISSGINLTNNLEQGENNDTVFTKILDVKSIKNQYNANMENSENDKIQIAKCSDEDFKMQRVIAPDVNYQLTSILEGVVNRGTGIKASYLNLPIAGKTGTTNNSYDSWFVGFTPNIVIGVHVGFDIPRSLGEHEYGATIALPIFTDAMKTIYPIITTKMPNEFTPPMNLIKIIPIDYKTGRKILPGQQGRMIYEVFKSGDMIQNEAKHDEEYGFDSSGFDDEASYQPQSVHEEQSIVKITNDDVKANTAIFNDIKDRSSAILKNMKQQNIDFFSGQLMDEEIEEGSGEDYKTNEKESQLKEIQKRQKNIHKLDDNEAENELGD